MQDRIFGHDKPEKLRTSEREGVRVRVIPFGLKTRTEAWSHRRTGVSHCRGDTVLHRGLPGCHLGPSSRTAWSQLRAESWRPLGRTASWHKGVQSGGHSADWAPPPSGEGANDESGSRWWGFRMAPPCRCVDGYCELLSMAMEGRGRKWNFPEPALSGADTPGFLVGRGTPKKNEMGCPSPGPRRTTRLLRRFRTAE